MTRLIYYEYGFESTTILNENERSVTSTTTSDANTIGVKARFAFDILHHDLNGDILGRYKVCRLIQLRDTIVIYSYSNVYRQHAIRVCPIYLCILFKVDKI